MKINHSKINFVVKPELLELAYQDDKQALLEIAQQAQREKRLGLAKNFFRLAEEATQKTNTAA